MISQDGDVAGDNCWTAPERTSLAAPALAIQGDQRVIAGNPDRTKSTMGTA
jgi:hypothetical protein